MRNRARVRAAVFEGDSSSVLRRGAREEGKVGWAEAVADGSVVGVVVVAEADSVRVAAVDLVSGVADWGAGSLRAEVVVARGGSPTGSGRDLEERARGGDAGRAVKAPRPEEISGIS